VASSTSANFAEQRRAEIRNTPLSSPVERLSAAYDTPPPAQRSIVFDKPAPPSPPPPPAHSTTSSRQQQRASDRVVGSDGSDSDGEHFERRLRRYSRKEGGVVSVRPMLTHRS
jgi:hypothetical protein